MRITADCLCFVSRLIFVITKTALNKRRGQQLLLLILIYCTISRFKRIWEAVWKPGREEIGYKRNKFVVMLGEKIWSRAVTSPSALISRALRAGRRPRVFNLPYRCWSHGLASDKPVESRLSRRTYGLVAYTPRTRDVTARPTNHSRAATHYPK